MILGSTALRGRTGHEAGRQLLSDLYARAAGGALPAIAVGPRGKPDFVNSPWHFSITHTPRHAFCVLAKAPIGIDAEELDRDIRLSLADKILSPGERKQFDAAEDPRLALLTFWVLKEAAVKASGEGLRGYPNDTAFTLDDPRVKIIDGCLVAVAEAESQLTLNF